MIAEAGLAALWLAAALALVQLALTIMVLRSDETREYAAVVRPVAIVQGGLAAFAMLLLIAVFVRSDMSVALVVQNSHSAKPLSYRIADAWGNHAGSLLLWVTMLALAGGVVAWAERRLDRRTLTVTLGAQATIALGFYAFLLFASNPFARRSPAPVDGLGLTFLLQDPGSAFHSPPLVAGYVGLSIAFCLAVGALVSGEVGRPFARAMRPWVLAAWILLTIGITAGSYRTYHELGRGIWWSWNPAENATLMPWLAATALLHSVSVTAIRDGLRAWTIMLAAVAFSMSMVGTLLFRAGITTSDAGTIDPGRGNFILALSMFYIGGAAALFFWRVGRRRAGAKLRPVSREGALVANNLLLSVLVGVVLIGTLYPIVAAVFGVQSSVGPSFFDNIAGPIALMLVALMAMGPLLRWRRDDAQEVLARLTVPIAMAAFAATGLVVLAGPINWLPLAGLAVAAGLAAASVAPLWRRNLVRAPLTIWGMVVAHFGMAVSLAGIACDSAFTRESRVSAAVGVPQRIGPWRVTLDGVQPVIGQNWSAIEARLTATRGETIRILRPQQRYFISHPTTIGESAIARVGMGHLYVVLGEQGADGRWLLRLWWKPFVMLTWLGGAIIAFGGLLALIGRFRRERRLRPLEEPT